MTVTNKQISDTIANAVATAQNRNLPFWQAATDDLIDLLVENGECFSSGEIASHLRTFRPDLVFSVTSNVGEHIRDRFYANTMPLYQNANGTHSPVEKVPRVTQGYTRTPPGTEVFVYGPSYTEAVNHAFEVDIPKPGTPLNPDPNDQWGLPKRPQQSATPKQHGTKLKPRKARRNLSATVHNDGRCCVPRSAFEELLHSTGKSLRGGDQVYVHIGEDEAVVSLSQFPNSRTYNLQATRGRIMFPRPTDPFTPGQVFKITVDKDKLVVDLS